MFLEHQNSTINVLIFTSRKFSHSRQTVGKIEALQNLIFKIQEKATVKTYPRYITSDVLASEFASHRNVACCANGSLGVVL